MIVTAISCILFAVIFFWFISLIYIWRGFEISKDTNSISEFQEWNSSSPTKYIQTSFRWATLILIIWYSEKRKERKTKLFCL
jgi:hypothetical protein